jgi:hypothetical protein
MAMRATLIAALVVVASCAALPQDTVSRPAVELTGRTAGAAQRCVLIDQSQSLRASETDLWKRPRCLGQSPGRELRLFVQRRLGDRARRLLLLPR